MGTVGGHKAGLTITVAGFADAQSVMLWPNSMSADMLLQVIWAKCKVAGSQWHKYFTAREQREQEQ